jgi:hypothetical protein
MDLDDDATCNWQRKPIFTYNGNSQFLASHELKQNKQYSTLNSGWLIGHFGRWFFLILNYMNREYASVHMFQHNVMYF